MHELIDGCDADAAALVELGLHHEQQHQELLLMDIKHVLHCNPTDPVYDDRAVHAALARADCASSPCPAATSRSATTAPGFCFDNERPRHVVHLEPMRIADRLVCAREYLEFIADDGYRRPELWLSDGWYAVQEHGWDAPLYWRDDGADGWTRLHARRAARRSIPTNRSCTSATTRPTRTRAGAARACPPSSSGSTRSRARRPARCARSTTSPGSGRRARTSPYPRFRPAPGAVGEYNGKFMSGQMTLRGGARVTSPGHTRVTYRNFFPPAGRWMFGGVRLAHDLDGGRHVSTHRSTTSSAG